MKRLLLDWSIGAKKKQEQRQSEQPKVRQARLDRQHVHSEESSVTFSRYIGVKLDGEGSVVSTCTEHRF